MATSEPRYNELDSLRGLAAATVAFGHLVAVVACAPVDRIAHPSWMLWKNVLGVMNITPLCVLMVGGPAVRFFFVLSGFVLMLPFLRHRDNPYFPFIVKRICRIYLPYLAAVILSATLCAWLGQKPLPGFTGTVAARWQQPVTLHGFIQHVMMLGNFDAAQYNPVLWSLVQEMRISLIFPLLALAVLRFRRWGLIALVVLLESASAIVPILDSHVDLGLQNFVVTPHFASLFVLGAVLAKHRVEIIARMGRLTRDAKVMFAGTAFVAYALSVWFIWNSQLQDQIILRISQNPTSFAHIAPAFGGYVVLCAGDWITALCAGTAICFALADRRSKAVLNHSLVLKTGRASYSLYLVHAVILLGLLFGLEGTRYLFLLVPLYLALTVLVTSIFYRWIELPTMRLGRTLAAKLGMRSSSSVAQTA